MNKNKKDGFSRRADRFALGVIVALLLGLVLGGVLVVAVNASAAGRFADVPQGAWYSEAVEWAVENGITNGVTADEFRPNEPCTRAEVVTFLWRYDRYRFGGGTEEPVPTEPTPTEPETTEPEITEPPETEPPVTEPEETEAPTEPEPFEYKVFDYSWTDLYWSGDEIIMEPLSGGRVSVYFPGIGEAFDTGETVSITFEEGYSAYMRGRYSWWLDMSLQEPVCETLNQVCTITVLDEDEIIIPGRLLADVDIVSVCMVGSPLYPARIRVETVP